MIHGLKSSRGTAYVGGTIKRRHPGPGAGGQTVLALENSPNLACQQAPSAPRLPRLTSRTGAAVRASHTAPGNAGATEQSPAAMSPAFLRLGEVMRITGLARSTVYRLMAEHGFPPPCRLGRRAVGWRSDDIAQWSAARPVLRR
jgi:prophage regulatory protein